MAQEYFPTEDGTPAIVWLVFEVQFCLLWVVLTSNGGTELKGDVGSSLENDKGNVLGWKSWNPLDGVGLAGGNKLALSWLGDNVEASGLGDDGGGGGQCQKAGLDNRVLHFENSAV